MKIWSFAKVYKILLLIVMVIVLPTELFQLTVGDACIERCSSRISWRWRSWCSINCPWESLKIGSTAFLPEVTRVQRNTFASSVEFKPLPTWEKVTDPIRTTTQSKISTKMTVKLTDPTTKVTQPTTTTTTTMTVKTSLSTLKTKTYQYPDIGRERNDELERVIQDNIDTQNVFFKLAGGLLGFCLVVFVVFFVLRSVKKPHRVSFTDDPIIIVQTDMLPYRT